jgi:hypothetical protein
MSLWSLDSDAVAVSRAGYAPGYARDEQTRIVGFRLPVGLDPAVRVVDGPRAGFPEPTHLPSRRPRKQLEAGGVASPSSLEEVRRCRADVNQAQVHVQAVQPHDVAKEPAEVIDAVGGGLDEQANASARGKEPLRGCRRRSSVALDPEEDFGSVDLNESHTLAVAKHNRVAVGDTVDPVDGRCGQRSGRRQPERNEHNNEGLQARLHLSAGHSLSQAIPSLSRSRPLLWLIAVR